MKKQKILLILALTGITWTSCTKEEEPGVGNSEKIEITEIIPVIEGTDIQAVVRAGSDYAVNNPLLDPTASLDGRENWKLRVNIHYNDAIYIVGSADFVWNLSNKIWRPVSTLFFPNDLTQKVEASMSPGFPVEMIKAEQTTPEVLLAQDVLSTAETATIVPAKIPTIRLEHTYSMLNFRIPEAIPGSTIEVLTTAIENGPTGPVTSQTRYKTYEVRENEFMVILPVALSLPQIVVLTPEGIEYIQTVNITTQKNTCYCFTLTGIELKLSPVTVKNWSTGQALSGDHTAETAYPTFRGPADETFIFHYDNGLEQTIRFNSQGECTIKPAGRTIEKIEYADKFLDLNYIIRDMIIDLTMFLEPMIQ